MRDFLISVLFSLCYSCVVQQPQTKTNTNATDPISIYHKEQNVTFYTVYPNGNIMIPGEWTRTKFNEQSSQQFFRRNSDSTIIGLGKNPRYKLSCYKRGMSDYGVVVAFYKQDSQYHESKGESVDLIEYNEGKVHIVWRSVQKKKLNTFFYGAKDGQIYNFVIEGDSLSASGDVTFLEKLFANN